MSEIHPFSKTMWTVIVGTTGGWWGSGVRCYDGYWNRDEAWGKSILGQHERVLDTRIRHLRVPSAEKRRPNAY